MRVLIVGCGYVGKALGKELIHQGHEVVGLTRTPDSHAELTEIGIVPLITDITKQTNLAKLPSAYDWVVNCVSSSRGDADYRSIYFEGTRNLIQWLSPTPPKKFVYTGSTSVYAQVDGSLVTELSPTEPIPETARILLETESVLLLAVTQGFPAVILRVAGIYGPGRGYWLRQFLNGEATIEGKGDRFLNMVHRDDVAGAIIAALDNGSPGQIYNVADDEPAPQIDLFRWLSKQLSKELPPSVERAQRVERKRGWTNKKISNAKLKSLLGYEFKYPTFRQGFLSALSDS